MRLVIFARAAFDFCHSRTMENYNSIELELVTL